MNDPYLLECIINYIRKTRTVFRPCLRYLISSWTHCVVFAIGARSSEIAGDVADHGAILGANSINGALWLDSCCIILFGTMHEANTRAGELRSFLTNGINRAGRRSPDCGVKSDGHSSVQLGLAGAGPTCGTTYPAVGVAQAFMGVHLHNGSGTAHSVLRARRLTNQTSLFALSPTPIAAVIILIS